MGVAVGWKVCVEDGEGAGKPISQICLGSKLYRDQLWLEELFMTICAEQRTGRVINYNHLMIVKNFTTK